MRQFAIARSKALHLALVQDVSFNTIAHLDTIQKQFIWKSRNPLCNGYVKQGLKNFFQNYKSAMFLVTKPYGDIFNAWKVIPLFLFQINFNLS